MSLPKNFSSPHDYFHAAIAFLKTHAWIYQNANTSFLHAGVLDQFPDDYVAYFANASNDELNRFPFVHEKLEMENVDLDDRHSHRNLQSFRRALRKLIPVEAFQQPAEVVNQPEKAPTLRRLNAKKLYEMMRLPPLIAQICCGGAVDVLVDFGSGLGYLSERLHQLEPSFRILGLEADQYRIEAAEKRLREYLPQAAAESGGAVVYKREFITEASSHLIEHSARQLLEGSEQTTPLKIAIIGLHACADLSITSMHLFLRMRAVRQLVIMPCCYHKLQLTAQEGGSAFVNFPLSACLKDAVAADDALSQRAYLNRPFLRLACQQSCQAWRSCSAQQHEAHGRAMFRRALADAIIDHNDNDDEDTAEVEEVVKLKRKVNLCREEEDDSKSVKEKEDDTFSALCRKYELIAKVSQATLPWTQRHEAKFNEISRRYDARLGAASGHKLAEGLTCLQTTMQKLCENIVLYDRLCYMKEFAAAKNLRINVRFEKLLNEKLSPRCYVLIAEKLEDAGQN